MKHIKKEQVYTRRWNESRILCWILIHIRNAGNFLSEHSYLLVYEHNTFHFLLTMDVEIPRFFHMITGATQWLSHSYPRAFNTEATRFFLWTTQICVPVCRWGHGEIKPQSLPGRTEPFHWESAKINSSWFIESALYSAPAGLPVHRAGPAPGSVQGRARGGDSVGLAKGQGGTGSHL